MPHRFTSLFPAGALALCLLAGVSTLAAGQDTGTAAGGSPERAFGLYCADCHGENGHGDGSKAFGLSVRPPDITRLSERNGGVFPRERLQAIIDGREVLKHHGDREMPAWGVWFKMEAEEDLGGAEGDEGTVERRIKGLIDYLESLQGS